MKLSSKERSSDPLFGGGAGAGGFGTGFGVTDEFGGKGFDTGTGGTGTGGKGAGRLGGFGLGRLSGRAPDTDVSG